MLSTTARAATIDLCGDYDEDVFVTKDDEVTMNCQVFIKEGAAIYIGEGSTICARNTGIEDLKPPTLVVERGAKIFATGTSEEPITFTSCDVSEDNRITAAGLWGGLVIVGRGVTAQTSLGTNANNDPEIEGLPGEFYGGDDPMDDSGVLQYVRVWYGGAAVSPDSEINGITFYSVGNGTTVDHIEVAFNLDDGIELFGGSVNMKFVSILFCGDDGIDMDEGYNGNIQFLFVMTGKDGHHGAEIDSQAYQVVNGELVRNPDTLPRTMPRVYNSLFVGSVHGTPQSVSSDDQRDALLRIREGAGGEWANLVAANVARVGLLQNTCGSEMRTHDRPDGSESDYFWFSPNNVISSIYHEYGFIENFSLDDGCEGLSEIDVVGDLGLINLPPTVDEDLLSIDPRPSPDSILFEDYDEVPDHPFFTPVDFRGAFGEDLWLSPWSWLAEFDHLSEP